MSHELTPVPKCPSCAALLPLVTNTFGEKGKPSDGDISMCLNCGAALRFTDDLQLRRLTVAEELDLHPENKRQLTKLQQRFWQVKGPRT
jgi:hypothetical protein